MLESIIFVMVIGLSVDYVVHMANAYLEANHESPPILDRKGRTQFMCKKMALSVLSGAVTSIGSSIFMCFAYIVFFHKFGIVVLWTILQSCLSALVFFVALMSLFGPEGDWGSIARGLAICKQRCCKSNKVADESCVADDSKVLETTPICEWAWTSGDDRHTVDLHGQFTAKEAIDDIRRSMAASGGGAIKIHWLPDAKRSDTATKFLDAERAIEFLQTISKGDP